MFRVELVPVWQVVPAAIGITADQTPEAQRWKLEPSMQFQSPSLVQAPVRPVPTAPEGEAAGVVPVEVGIEVSTEVTTLAVVEVCMVVGAAIVVVDSPGGEVMKTPPGLGFVSLL